MRTMSLVAVAAAVAMLGCNNGQPRLYRVAVDATALEGGLPPSCYVNNSPPGTTAGSTRTIVANFRTELEWAIWDGVDGTQYLDMGSITFPLGDAAPITVSTLIEGRDNVFNATRTDQILVPDSTQMTETRNRVITVTFDDQGASPTGNIKLVSTYQCANCGNAPEQAGNRSCEVTLNFVARRIDTTRTASYNENP